MTITDELIDRLEKALRDYDMELLGCYDVHPEAYENDVEAPEHRRAFVDHMLKLAHPDLMAALAAERTARDNLVHQLRAVERELRFAIFLTSPKTQRLQEDRNRLMKAIEQL